MSDMSGTNGHRTWRPLIYRSLDEQEWPRAAKILAAHNMHVPHAKLATAHVAETLEGEIVGMGILQMVPHAEPWVIEDGWHGRVDLLRIEKLMASRLIGHPILPGYVLVAVDEKQSALAELAGFHLQNGVVYVKDFTQTRVKAEETH